MQTVKPEITPRTMARRNLTEGDFDSNPTRNVSFTSEIGSDQDPGREAALKFELEMAETSEAAALPVRKGTTHPPSPRALMKKRQPYG